MSLLDPYIKERQKRSYNVSQLQKFTTKYGKHKGQIYNVALDAYEAKFHSRFANIRNNNQHEFLMNWKEGIYVF